MPMQIEFSLQAYYFKRWLAAVQITRASKAGVLRRELESVRLWADARAAAESCEKEMRKLSDNSLIPPAEW